MILLVRQLDILGYCCVDLVLDLELAALLKRELIFLYIYDKLFLLV